MNKLFWIVCEDKNTTLYEGRFQGRTRTAAIRFLKATLGVKSLENLVFTVTEIPVPIIREIILEVLGTLQNGVWNDIHQIKGTSLLDNKPHTVQTEPSIPRGATMPHGKSERKVGNPGLGDDFWGEVQAYWNDCRSIMQTAIKFKLSQNSVKTRARREGWRKINLNS